jgi:hypothetical protein
MKNKTIKGAYLKKDEYALNRGTIKEEINICSVCSMPPFNPIGRNYLCMDCVEKQLQSQRVKWIGEIEKFIEQERIRIDNHKGTWGGEIEKVFPSMEYFLDEFEKDVLKKLKE